MKQSRRTFLKVSGVAVAGTAIATQVSPWDLGIPSILRPNTSRDPSPAVEDFFPTTCWIGKQDCGMLARRIDGRVVSLEGHPDHPRNAGTLCPKGEAQVMAFYDPNRVKTPLQRRNEKGVRGEWESISWDAALALVAQKVNEVRARDPSLVLWQKGRSKAGGFYDTAFVKTIGATKMGHGAYCSDAGYRAAEYTIGLHGVLHPDFRHTRYLLSWGWNITNAGGNKFCWITWPRQLMEARDRGIKVVQIDPRLRGAGPFADAWLPIKPGTDLALALALCNVLVENDYVDTDYLTKYTNSTFLVKDDGHFYRVGDREQVWDTVTGGPKDYDDPTAVPTLEGEYSVGGETVRTAFQLFREHVASYTPEWAAGVCDLSATKIREVAIEMGENAQIGSTINVDGVEVPYRPVGIMAYHMSQQELGFQALRAMIFVGMLLGAVGAAGGVLIDFTWKIHKNYAGLDNITVGDPPYNFYLKDSKFFPINTGLPGVVAKVMQDPDAYGVEAQALPEVAILHMANPLTSFLSQADFIESYKKFDFVAAITPWLSETADYFADVVLPSATIEKYEGPLSVSDQYIDAKTLRLPPMEPLFQSKGEIDIYLDLCERMGILTGDGGYIDQINDALGLEDPYALDTNVKPGVRDVFNQWALSQGLEDGVGFFEENGVWVKGPLSATQRYGYAAEPPFGGVIHRLYGESLLRYQEEMRAKGVDESYWRDYTPFPTWRSPTMDASPADYNLYLISYKLIEQKQSRSSFIPLLAELTPEQRLDINPETARARGIAEGDEVWVESHNAVTGETRRVRVKAALTEGIRPDTVGMPHHFGMWTHPWNEGQGPTPSALYYTGEGYWTNTADQSFHVKVKVTPAGGED
ncbi:MAG: molybdopterin-dependent oxidoreductase [Thermoplasmata archaeon]